MKDRPSPPEDDRRKRLAEALRSNLQRRKAQSRERDRQPPPEGGAPAPRRSDAE